MKYHINCIYTEPDYPYRWETMVLCDILQYKEKGYAIEAPCQSGKTYLCMEVLKHWMCVKEYSNFLYFSPHKKTVSRVAYTLGIEREFKNDTLAVDSFLHIVQNGKRSNSLFIPETYHELSNVLTSAIPFYAILVDDADMASYQAILDIIDKADIDGARIIFIGSDAHPQNASYKSAWEYIKNNPDYTVYRISDPELIEAEEPVVYFQDLLMKLKSRTKFPDIIHRYRDRHFTEGYLQ